MFITKGKHGSSVIPPIKRKKESIFVSLSFSIALISASREKCGGEMGVIIHTNI